MLRQVLTANELGRMDLREALAVEALAEELADTLLDPHDAVVGRDTEVEPPEGLG